MKNKQNTFNDTQATLIGLRLADFLRLRKKKGFYQTTFGPKTALGLYRAVVNILDSDTYFDGETVNCDDNGRLYIEV